MLLFNYDILLPQTFTHIHVWIQQAYCFCVCLVTTTKILRERERERAREKKKTSNKIIKETGKCTKRKYGMSGRKKKNFFLLNCFYYIFMWARNVYKYTYQTTCCTQINDCVWVEQREKTLVLYSNTLMNESTEWKCNSSRFMNFYVVCVRFRLNLECNLLSFFTMILIPNTHHSFIYMAFLSAHLYIYVYSIFIRNKFDFR